MSHHTGLIEKHCLIIDDSPVIRKVARLIVEQMHYVTIEAETAEKALEFCDKGIPELILLDWHLPGMSSHDFLSELAPKLGHIRPVIIYCTTELERGDITVAFATGATDYILKPFDRESLREKIQTNMSAVAA